MTTNFKEKRAWSRKRREMVAVNKKQAESAFILARCIGLAFLVIVVSQIFR